MQFKPCKHAVVLTLLLSFILPARCVHAQVGEVTLGAALAKMMDELNQAIADARNAGSSLEIQAGKEAAIAIEDARNAYSKSLDETFNDHIDPTIKRTVDSLQSLVNDVQKKTFQKVDDVTARAQQIVNSLPFRDHEPQLTKFTPDFVVPTDQNYSVPFVFYGNFEFSAQKKYAALLTIGVHKYSCTENTTGTLKYLVPSGDLFPIPSGANANEFEFTNGILSVPWRASSFFGLFGHSKLDEYHVVVGALPASPGKITLTHQEVHTETKTQTYHGPNHHQCSTRECGNGDDKNHDWSDRPDDGWHLVRGTVRLTHIGQGDYSGPDLISDDGNVAITRATTIHHGAGSSGSIDFSVTFQEAKDVPMTNMVSEVVSMKWSDSKVINYPPGTWTIYFDAFDGSHAEFRGADNNNRFITITSEAGSDVIVAANPAKLTE
jgi:hypothetical protein